MQVFENRLRTVKVDGRFAAVARDNRALNRSRSGLDPRAHVRDETGAVRELNDGQKPWYLGGRSRDRGAMRDLSQISMSNPVAQLDVDRTEVLGQTMTLRFHGERRR